MKDISKQVEKFTSLFKFPETGNKTQQELGHKLRLIRKVNMFFFCVCRNAMECCNVAQFCLGGLVLLEKRGRAKGKNSTVFPTPYDFNVIAEG